MPSAFIAWQGQPLPFALEINVRENRVQVETTRALWDSLDRLAALSDQAKLSGVHRVTSQAANLYGGLFLSSCTAGFGVKNAQGTKGISTAGHCSNTQSFGGHNLPYVTGKFSGAHDSQWHTSGGNTILDDVKYGGGLVRTSRAEPSEPAKPLGLTSATSARSRAGTAQHLRKQDTHVYWRERNGHLHEAARRH